MNVNYISVLYLTRFSFIRGIKRLTVNFGAMKICNFFSWLCKNGRLSKMHDIAAGATYIFKSANLFRTRIPLFPGASLSYRHTHPTDCNSGFRNQTV